MTIKSKKIAISDNNLDQIIIQFEKSHRYPNRVS